MEAEHPLVTEYRSTIPEKIAHIEQLIGDLKTKVSQETVTTLRMAVHKLAGSSGTYGFERCSRLCRDLDADLKLKLENFSLDFFNPEYIKMLELFLVRLKNFLMDPDVIIKF